MQITMEAFVGILATIVAGGFGWLMTLQGRQTDTQRGLSAHEAACEQRQKNLDERHEAMMNAIHSLGSKIDKLYRGVQP